MIALILDGHFSDRNIMTLPMRDVSNWRCVIVFTPLASMFCANAVCLMP